MPRRRAARAIRRRARARPRRNGDSVSDSRHQQGAISEAIAAFREAVRISDRNVANLAALAHALGLARMETEARSLLEELSALRDTRCVSGYDLALAQLGVGDPVEAVAWLERGYEERAHAAVFAKVDPRLDPLRSNPTFARLLDRLWFP